MLLAEPKTIRERENLGPLETTAYREKGAEYPRALYQIYIEDGIARVAVCQGHGGRYIYEHYDKFEDIYDIGPADDVAIEFDGYWERISPGQGERKYDFISVGEPWLFRVVEGDLVVQQGENGEPETLATGITGRIHAMRGWKNTSFPEQDYGLLIGYLKNGTLYYRTRAEQGDGSVHWELEKEIEGFTGDVSDFSFFRATDYRMGVMAEVEGDVYVSLTKRNWSLMAIGDELIDATLTDYNLPLNPIMFTIVGDGPFPSSNQMHWKDKLDLSSENISSSLIYENMLLWAGETQPVSAGNIMSVESRPDSLINVGDGEETEFKTMWYPLVEESEVVKLDGETQTRGVDYEVSYSDGKITFYTPPPSDVEVSASYDWYSWGHRIKVKMDKGITDKEGHQDYVDVNCAYDSYTCNGTSGGGAWDGGPGLFEGTREWILSVSNFNESEGDITVGFSGEGLKGEAGQGVDSFTISFTPQNLVEPRVTAEAPEVEAIWNE